MSLDQKKQDLDLFKASVKLAENQKAEDLKASERALRDLEEKLAGLNADQQQMTVRAPFTGLVNYRGFEPGDRVNPSVAIIDLLDLSQYEAKFTLSAADLRSVHTGDKIHMHINDLPDVDLKGEIEEISPLPTLEGQAQLVRFPAKAKIEPDAELRPWLKIHIDVSGPKLKNVLSIPRGYVYYADGKAYCNRRDGTQSKKHEITLGTGNTESVECVKGLFEGDVVVKPK